MSQGSYSYDVGTMMGSHEFEHIVAEFYAPLYRFALSLTRQETDARDLTQQTFLIWARKGHQLRDAGKLKTWLFTTLHREYLHGKRRQNRFPHHSIDHVEAELPQIEPHWMDQIDGRQLVTMLGRVDEVFQAPIALFYLDDHSYKEIAEILDVPLGTVKSRIARGMNQLQQIVVEQMKPNQPVNKPTT